MADHVTAVEGAELAWSETGTGSPVLLLHAGVADRRMWAPLTAALAGGRRLIAPDLRGFGDTRYDGRGFSHARDALAVLDAAGVESATVLGNSFGGQVALEVAALAPERVERLLVAAPPLPDWEWSDAVRAFGAAEDAALEGDDLDAAVEINLAMWVDRGAPGAPWRGLVAQMQRRAFELQLAIEPQYDDVEPDLSTLGVPTVVLVGDRDIADFVAIARHVAATIPEATLEVIGGAGHLLPLERPDAIADAILGP